MSWVRDILIAKGAASSGTLAGLSEDEICGVENRTHLSLPKAYKDFLADAGRSAGRLAEDLDFFYPVNLELRAEAEELILEEDGDYILPPDAFVFCGYQGFDYYFFVCGEDDPPVWRVLEYNLPPKKVAESFSDFFRRMVALSPEPRKR